MAATILLVEDERKLRDLVRSYLERAGFTVLTTGSGAEALSLAASASPDLLILDLGRPERFVNMLRIFKPRSPMSMGAWALTLFGNLAAAAVGAAMFALSWRLFGS